MSLEGEETQDTSHGCESEGSSESGSSGLASSGPSASSSSSASGTSTGSLLSLLKCPPPSHLARKRKTVTNPPVGVKRSREGTSTQILKSIGPSDCVRQYPNERLTVSAGCLFCNACREELSLKKSVVDHHVKSSIHNDHKKKLDMKTKQERDIAQCLEVYSKEVHPQGESLPMSTVYIGFRS